MKYEEPNMQIVILGANSVLTLNSLDDDTIIDWDEDPTQQNNL